MTLDDEILAVFHDEVGEHLEELTRLLDGAPGQWDVREAFQLSHNMKGAARMVGAKAVARITHILEDLFSALRSGHELDDRIVGLARRGCLLLEKRFFNPNEDLSAVLDAYAAKVAQVLEGGSEGLNEGDGGVADAESTESTETHRDEKRGTEGRDSAQGAASMDEAEEEEQEDEADSDPGTATPVGETVRVSTEKLDRLMGLSAEVSISGRAAHYQSGLVRQLLQTANQLRDEFPQMRKDEKFRSLLNTTRNLNRSISQGQDRQNKFARELREMARQLRMVPLQSLATVFSRVVRQACRVSGKKAQFHIEGGQTELDRGVLDAIRDPVIHLLRNAVAHGIEDEVSRIAAGKARRGTVLLRARSAGAWVELEVSDDGAGLDLEALRQRALERELLSAEQARSAELEEMEKLIFAPGFSGSAEVSELSGRGVGLDVVESNLSELGGKVVLENRPGQGMTFVLRVPLTRLTSKMLHVELGAHKFLVPMSDVVTTARISNDELKMADGQQVAPVGGDPVPLTSLETLIEVGAEGEEVRPGVLLASERRRRLFLVDRVVGEEDILIQSLRWNLQAMELYAGCAVLADGDVALVLDVQVLLGGPAGRVDADWIGGSRQRARQRRVLVVDDSVTSRTLIENILSSAGYAVTVAVDGLQACDEVQDISFDLVITDVEMPRLDGFGLVKRLRSEKVTERVPIIMVTSLGQEEHMQRAAELGADEYIVKGAFDQDALLAAVARLL